MEGLTSDEKKVAELLVSGYKNKEIASTLNWKERKVTYCISRLFDKAGVSSDNQPRVQFALLYKGELSKDKSTTEKCGTEERRNAIIQDKLTQREREIAELIVQGYNNERIAETLNIKEGTIKTYINYIYKKLGITGETNQRLRLIEKYTSSDDKGSVGK